MAFRQKLVAISEKFFRLHLKPFNCGKQLVNCYSNQSNDNNGESFGQFWPQLEFSSENKSQFIPKEIYKLGNTSNETKLRRLSSSSGDQWSRVVSNAEQMVEYPTSFMGLRFFLKEDFNYLTLDLKRLIESNHPLLKTAKTLFGSNQQIRGLIVLLLSKAYSVPKHIADNFETNFETNPSSRVRKYQRKLAEITDMIHVSQLLHKGVVDLPEPEDCNDYKEREDLTLGNNTSVIIGNYLLAHSSRALAQMGSPLVTGFMSKAISSYTEAEFLWSEPVRSEDSFHLLEQYCYLSGGSLLGHSCRSALVLAQFDCETQSKGFLIGQYIGIALQLSHLLSNKPNADQKIDTIGKRLSNFDSNTMKLILSLNVGKALQLIQRLEPSESTTALKEIVVNIENHHNCHGN